jgi:hypothetical protein
VCSFVAFYVDDSIAKSNALISPVLETVITVVIVLSL